MAFVYGACSPSGKIYIGFTTKTVEKKNDGLNTSKVHYAVSDLISIQPFENTAQMSSFS